MPSTGASESRSGGPIFSECFTKSMTRAFSRPSLLSMLALTIFRPSPPRKRRSEAARQALRSQHREHTKSQILALFCNIIGCTFDHGFERSPTENQRSRRHAESASEAAQGGRSRLENVGRKNMRVIGWLAGWVAGWVGGWLAGWLAGGLAGWPAGWLAGWLAEVAWCIELRIGPKDRPQNQHQNRP